MTGIRWVAAGLVFWLALGSGAAVADEDGPDRLAKLEALLYQQAEQLELMQAELAALKRQQVEAPSSASEVIPPPAATSSPQPGTGSPPPGPRATAADPCAAPAVRDHHLDDGTLRTSSGRSLSRGLSFSNVRWGGYLTLEYVSNSDQNSYFDLHRFVLNASAQITNCIDMNMELEIEHGGVSDELEGEIVIEQMEVTFRMSDAFNPKLGALLIPFGRFNKYHDDPWNDFTKRPWTARYLVPTGFGQPGIGVEGVFPAGCGGRLTYNAALTQGFKDGFTAEDGVRDARQFWKSDNNDSKQLWGRLAYLTNNRAFDFFEAGLSGTWGRFDDDDDNALFGYALDLTARKGPFDLHLEYVRMDYDRNSADPIDAVRGQDALWAELGYHFFPAPLCCCRNCLIRPTSHFTLAFRYQRMDLDDRRVGADFNDDLQSYGIALNYRITEGSVFRIDYTWLEARRDDDQRELTLSFSTFF